MRSFIVAVALACALAPLPAPAQGNAATAVYRYRAAIASLLQLKPGMVAAEVGPAAAVIVPEMTPKVAANGRAFAATLDKKTGATNLEPASVDAIALIAALGPVEQPKALLDGLAAALKPGGTLLVVDVPQENDGKKVVGMEADDVV